MDKPWNYESVVDHCQDCGGRGWVHDNTVWATDCRTADCDNCAGDGKPFCIVCGFGHCVPGYDCIVCAMVFDIPAKLLTAEGLADMQEALGCALEAARQESLSNAVKGESK